MKTSRIVFALLTAAVLTVSTAGCAGTKSISYQDGTYSGRSSDHKDDEDGNGSGYGEAESIVKKTRSPPARSRPMNWTERSRTRITAQS